MSHVFEAEQWVSAPLENVFRFFCDPRNLAVISPPSSGVRLKSLRLVPPSLDGIDGSDRMAGIGTEVEVSFRLLPYLPIRGSLTARIVEFEWLQRFRDVEVKGPFRKFDHTHSFVSAEQNGKAGTVIHDHVEYELPFGALGQMANVLAVKVILRLMFAWRQNATSRALENSTTR